MSGRFVRIEPAFTDLELDTLIAERVMGWERIIRGNWHVHYWKKPDAGLLRISEYRFSSDRNAAALVVDRIGEMGLGNAFGLSLWGEHSLDYASTAGEIGWAFLATTPRQICEAALECVERAAELA